MASSRDTSNGPDWLDMAEMLKAFEEQNNCRIAIEIARWTTSVGADLSVTAKAWELEADRRVAKPLALVNVTWRRERFRTMEGLFTFLLYQLDFQLGEHEWGGTEHGNKP